VGTPLILSNEDLSISHSAWAALQEEEEEAGAAREQEEFADDWFYYLGVKDDNWSFNF
jgi:hypothetical protein